MANFVDQELEIFDVGPCEEAYTLGFLIGQKFSNLFKSRSSNDLILQEQLLPFASTTQGKALVEALQDNNRKRYPRYWDELVGMAEGSGVPLEHVMLLNFRKEIQPFILKKDAPEEEVDDDCSDILIVNEPMAIVAHNEDANVALLDHTYLVRAVLPNGLSFTAYTYACELPSCAFGFNSNGVAFTLDSVPPLNNEIAAGGIARNFVSRDLLEARDLEDAMNRICSPNVSVGHSYNLVHLRSRKVLNVETASGNRFSVHEAGATPFFHANMYQHLRVQQVQDENSIRRRRRAALLAASSKDHALAVLGDVADDQYPIYMQGPTLYTLCTVVIDLDEGTMTIYKGNPKNKDIAHVLQVM